MATNINNEISNYIKENISAFHEKRLEKLKTLKIKDLLKRKNPYLFKCKNILIADELIQLLLDRHLSSQEETMFGNFLEGVAIFINEKIYQGHKSSAEGIDLEFTKDDVRYLVSIKSGSNWGNSSQIKKMEDNFKKAQRTLRTSGNMTANIIAINGCCYGKSTQKDKGDYFKYCGQEFWEFISGQADLYMNIIEPLGHEAKIRNEKIDEEYAKIKNKCLQGFMSEFCKDDGRIDWDLFVQYNSAAVRRKRDNK